MSYGYPQEVQEGLLRNGISVWDRIRVKKNGTQVEGILLPRPNLLPGKALVIKLDNGYNVGVLLEGATVELVAKGASPTEPQLPLASNTSGTGETKISLLSAGGTISSRVDYSTGAVFPALTAQELASFFPELSSMARIKTVPVFNLLSEDMHPKHWISLAEKVYSEVAEGADGVVITHGTDTMHYTAAALSFMLPDVGVPVVLVGAQRSSDRGSSDNVMNLDCAVAAAASDLAGVYVVMHGSMSDDYCLVHQGTRVRKMHTSRRDAFRSIGVSPVAKVTWAMGEKPSIEYLKERKKRVGGPGKLDVRLDERVGLIYVHPGISPEMIESLSSYYDGIVLAGTGLGHAPTNPGGDPLARSVLPAIRSLISSGIPVVMAPQTIYGRINMNVYAAGRLLKEAGVIGDGCDWTPEAALVKLMFVLGHTKDMRQVKVMMERDLAGEITTISHPGAFLT